MSVTPLDKSRLPREFVRVSNSEDGEMKIFLSHSSSDTKYGDALECLFKELGIKKEQLIYTSHEDHLIPPNENIYKYLRERLHERVFVIFLWSDNFLNSPGCMKELGATWYAEIDYLDICVPQFAVKDSRFRDYAIDPQQTVIELGKEKEAEARMKLFITQKLYPRFGLSVGKRKLGNLLVKFIQDVSQL